jgi:ABC-type antimicrobial peptide transport system permease subunit
MTALALRSLRHRAGGFAASFIAMFLGATMLMAFASMLDTAGGAHVDADSEETLFNMATIVGGWGLIIIAFAVASTLTLSVRQRGAEMALLKNVGATPAQVGRMIVGEAALVSLVAAAAAIPPAILGGRLLFERLQATDQVAPAVDYAFGPVAIGMGLGITFVGATIAALVTARRAARMRASEALLDAEIDRAPMRRRRIVAAFLFLALGLDTAIVTMTVFNGEGIDAMQTAGQASIWASIGLALLAPALVRRVSARLARVVERRGGAAGYLAAQNVRQRTRETAGALMPIILFTAIATGTLYMQSIENAADPAANASITAAEARNIETLNLVVVGMIAVFAAIMLINTLVAATARRRREFGRQRLAGSTPPQVLRMVSLEGAVLAATGVLFGSLAALFTVVPYSVARTGSIVPEATPAIYLGVVALAASLTLASGVGAARRTIRTPAVEAAA